MNYRKHASTIPPEAKEIDWFRVCADIKKLSGLSYLHMADLLGVSHTLLSNIRDGNTDPRYKLGQRLLNWQESLSTKH